MNHIGEAVVWLNDPLNWTNPGGILDRLGEHLTISALAERAAAGPRGAKRQGHRPAPRARRTGKAKSRAA